MQAVNDLIVAWTLANVGWLIFAIAVIVGFRVVLTIVSVFLPLIAGDSLPDEIAVSVGLSIVTSLAATSLLSTIALFYLCRDVMDTFEPQSRVWLVMAVVLAINLGLTGCAVWMWSKVFSGYR
ncbi:hypothetical protein PY365_28660 [Roseiarcaceae bacterium H3SJ34-1]|uniref:hypothetical protein n=1 Tax=Terripilifer ovatus TaxID=3032367 RepID=UPI003AB99E5B|nr:hypothetical protein [Roseiarcaceae bacterium H3SJ34-1]